MKGCSKGWDFIFQVHKDIRPMHPDAVQCVGNVNGGKDRSCGKASANISPCVGHIPVDRFETRGFPVTTTMTALKNNRSSSSRSSLRVVIRSPFFAVLRTSIRRSSAFFQSLFFEVCVVLILFRSCLCHTSARLNNVASEDAPQQSCQCFHGTENK